MSGNALKITHKRVTGNSGNMTGKLPLLGILIPLLGMSGCTTTIVQESDCPLRPELTPIDIEMQADIPPYTLHIIAENQLKLKAHIKNLEAVANCK